MYHILFLSECRRWYTVGACHDCDLTEFECHRVSEGVFSILDQAHMIENISEVVSRAFTHVLTGLKRVDIND